MVPVDGDLQASSGSVAPGIFQSSFDGGVVDAINFDFTGVQDDAPLMQTSVLAGGLRLVSGLDFGSGVRPRNADNGGNEFNVTGFPSHDNYGSAANNGECLTFTIAPANGLRMLIDDVSVLFRRNGTGAAKKYGISTSIDGFAYPDRWGDIQLNDTDTSIQDFTVSNPSTEATADEVEIRIVGVQATSDSGSTHVYAASVDASFTSDPNNVIFDPTGILDLGGDYTQLAFGVLEIEMGGTSNLATDNAEYDQLDVAGNVQLDGTLDLSFVDNFSPSVGDTFDIITANSVSGSFSTVNMPADFDLEVTYGNNFVRVEVVDNASLLGDVNFDGAVNFSDIGPFIGLLTSGVYLLEADINMDGDINFLDIGPFIGLLLN